MSEVLQPVVQLGRNILGDGAQLYQIGFHLLSKVADLERSLGMNATHLTQKRAIAIMFSYAALRTKLLGDPR